MIYDLARGPLVWVAVIVFVGGVLGRFVQLFRMTRKRERVAWPTRNVRGDSPEERKVRPILSLRHSLLGQHPVMAISSGLFHACLFGSALFAQGHIYLLRESWGIGLWSLPNRVTDFLTVVVLAGALFLLGRRLMIPHVRAVSSGSDFLLLLVTFTPYLTGFLAYHQLFHYRTVITMHMLFGELLLIAAPFTKLGHMVFFFFARGLIGSEHSVARGDRVWST